MQNVGYSDEKRLSIDANLMLIFYSFGFKSKGLSGISS